MKNGISDFVRQVYQGRTIYRLLFNQALSKAGAGLTGRGLDLASGNRASYYNYLPTGLAITRSDYQPGPGIDVVIDINQPLRLESNQYDFVLFSNALYVVKEPSALMREIYRILKPGGKLIIVSPFISNEMPEPDDFCRLTAQGLEKLLAESDFCETTITRFGERFTVAAYVINPVLFFKTLRLLVYSGCLFLDRLIPEKIKRLHPTPLGYLVASSKPLS